MSGETPHNDLPAPPDPFGVSIQQAKNEGWLHLPMVTCHGGVVGALIRPNSGYIDLVTLPESGLSEVRRVLGGPSPNRPRFPGDVQFTHQVPVHVALQWLLVMPWDDGYLAEWTTRHYHPKEQTRGEH